MKSVYWYFTLAIIIIIAIALRFGSPEIMGFFWNIYAYMNTNPLSIFNIVGAAIVVVLAYIIFHRYKVGGDK